MVINMYTVGHWVDAILQRVFFSNNYDRVHVHETPRTILREIFIAARVLVPDIPIPIKM